MGLVAILSDGTDLYKSIRQKIQNMNGQKEMEMALPKLSTLILPHSHFFAYFISILFRVCISMMCPKSLLAVKWSICT